MTGNYLLDWAIMAVSLFNTILLLWLGLTVLLTTEHRTWGVWLVGGSLLIGGAFFISHSIILGYEVDTLGQELNFWWRAGWLPVVIAPAAWYVAMLWYGGYWNQAPCDSAKPFLQKRQRPWLMVVSLLAVSLVGLLIFANPLPTFMQLTRLRLSAALEIGGIPVLTLVYPLYMILCIALSLDTLRYPTPSERVMGDLARRRARPWLIATTVILLGVSLLVTWAMIWIVLAMPSGRTRDITLAVGGFDLAIDLLIALAVILMGRAIVSYEVFTGKTLPRRGFFRHWRSAVILAGGYGLVVGWSLAFQLRPIYSLLLTTILMVLFYALFSWRSFVERDHYINRLRPFVASQRLYEHLIAATPSQTLPVIESEHGDSSDATAPFHALCTDILGSRLAYLVALGPLAPLVGPTLAYPDNMPAPRLHGASLPTSLSPQTMCLPLDPAQHGGALWAVPLWSERGLIGALLLGEKRDGGLYTLEEIEIARASGERLIDTQASAELARRLMSLQRQQLAQTQVLDRQTRRVLHDDILPGLHTAMLLLSNGHREETDGHMSIQYSEAVTLLTAIHHQISDLLREMPTTVASEVARLGLVSALRRAVDEELSRAFDQVTWRIEPEAEHQAQAIPPLTGEVLFYAAREAIRNAARHGRADATAPLYLKVTLAWQNGLEIIIEDNGIGLDPVSPSNSGSPPSGSGQGQGLALHSTMMAVVGGMLAIESVPDTYTRVLLTLPHSHLSSI